MKTILSIILIFFFLAPVGFADSGPSKIPSASQPVFTPVEYTVDGVHAIGYVSTFWSASGDTDNLRYGIQSATPIQIPEGTDKITLYVYRGVGRVSDATANTVVNVTGYINAAGSAKLHAYYLANIFPRKEDAIVGSRNLGGIIGSSGRAADANIYFATSGSALPKTFYLDTRYNQNTPQWMEFPTIDEYGVYNYPAASGQWFMLSRFIVPGRTVGPDGISVQFSRRTRGER
jgi:hypothetical protein